MPAAKPKKKDPRCSRKIRRWNQKPLSAEERRRICGTKKRTPQEKKEARQKYKRNKAKIKKQKLAAWRKTPPKEKMMRKKRANFLASLRRKSK